MKSNLRNEIKSYIVRQGSVFSPHPLQTRKKRGII